MGNSQSQKVSTAPPSSIFISVDHEIEGQQNVPRLSKLTEEKIPNGGACARAGETLKGQVIVVLDKRQTELTGKLELSLVAEEEVIVDGQSSPRVFKTWSHFLVVRDWETRPQTLAKGTYGLPFEIALPDDLPCSMSCVTDTTTFGGSSMGVYTESKRTNQCWIRYRLEARYQGAGGTTTRKFDKYIGIISATKAFPDEKPSVICRWLLDDTILVGGKLDSSVVYLGKTIQVSFLLLNTTSDKRPCRSVDVRLKEYASWTTDPSPVGKESLRFERYNRCLYKAKNVVSKTILEGSSSRRVILGGGSNDTLTDGQRKQELDQMTKILQQQQQQQQQQQGKGDTTADDIIRVEIPVYGNARLSQESKATRVWHAVEIKVTTGDGGGVLGSRKEILSLPVTLVH